MKDDPQHILNDTLINIENVDLSSATFAVEIMGDDKDNIIKTGSGDDIIHAGDGNDTIFAGGGNDTVYASWGADHEDGGEGNDTFIIEETLDFIPVFDLSLETGTER